MKRRLYWATFLLCLSLRGMAISPGPGPEARPADTPSVGRVPAATSTSITVQTPAPVRKSLHYFRFDAGKCLPDTAVPRDISTGSAPVTVSLPDVQTQLRKAEDDARRLQQGAGIGAYFAGTMKKLQAFGTWCRDTAGKVANLYHAIADSCRRLRAATAAFSSAKAEAAALPAPPASAPTNPAAVSSNYQFLWENDRGDCIYSFDPNFDPNRGGKPIWRRVKR